MLFSTSGVCKINFGLAQKKHSTQNKHYPGIPTTIKTMGVNITTIDYLRVLIIEIGSTIILMVVEAQGLSIQADSLTSIANSQIQLEESWSWMTLTWARRVWLGRKNGRNPWVGSPRVLFIGICCVGAFKVNETTTCGCFPTLGVFPPKWMVKIMENSFKWMIWGYHYFRKHPCRTPRPTIYFKGCFNWMMMMNQVFLHRKWNSIGSSRNIHLKN